MKLIHTPTGREIFGANLASLIETGGTYVVPRFDEISGTTRLINVGTRDFPTARHIRPEDCAEVGEGAPA